MKNNYLSRAISQEQYSIWSWFLVYLCKMMFFFNFFKILIFWVVSVVKGQKMVQNYKKFCLLCFISQESYIIWLSLVVHLCELMISPGVFFIFSKFWFSGLLEGGVKGQKMVQNEKKFCHAPYLRNHTYDHHLWYANVKW